MIFGENISSKLRNSYTVGKRLQYYSSFNFEMLKHLLLGNCMFNPKIYVKRFSPNKIIRCVSGNFSNYWWKIFYIFSTHSTIFFNFGYFKNRNSNYGRKYFVFVIFCRNYYDTLILNNLNSINWQIEMKLQIPSNSQHFNLSESVFATFPQKVTSS